MLERYFTLQHGFTYIEVLIALSLLMLCLVDFKAIQLKALQLHQYIYFQTIAIERLSSISAMVRLGMSHAINEQDMGLLPQGRVEMSRDKARIILRVFWPCRTNECWHCLINPQPHRACEELRMAA